MPESACPDAVRTAYSGRVAAVQLNVRPVEFVAAEDVAPEPERSVSKHGYLSVAQ